MHLCRRTLKCMHFQVNSVLQLDRRVNLHCRRVCGCARGRDPHTVLPGGVQLLAIGLGKAVTGLLIRHSSSGREHYLVLKGDMQLRQVYSGPLSLAMVVWRSPLSARVIEDSLNPCRVSQFDRNVQTL
jgi:hypothetical protein